MTTHPPIAYIVFTHDGVYSVHVHIRYAGKQRQNLTAMGVSSQCVPVLRDKQGAAIDLINDRCANGKALTVTRVLVATAYGGVTA